MNYYRRYVGDYLRDTATLSLMEHGAYNLLLDYAYATEQAIPADQDEVFRLVRAFTDAERKAVKKVLDRYWQIQDDGYHNPRVDDELGKAVKLIEKQKANGSLGGRPKKTQQETQTQTQSESQTITQNNQPPTTNHQPPAASLQPPAKSTALSGKPDATKPNGNGKLHADAIEILETLNAATGRSYQPVKANIGMIEARLKDGATPDQIKAVIADRCARWSADEKMVEFLRPKTLFNAINFANYQGELRSSSRPEWMDGMI